MALHKTSYCKALLLKLDALKAEFELPSPNLELLRTLVDNLEIHLGYLERNLKNTYFALTDVAESEETRDSLRKEYEDIDKWLLVLFEAEDMLGMPYLNNKEAFDRLYPSALPNAHTPDKSEHPLYLWNSR